MPLNQQITSEVHSYIGRDLESEAIIREKFSFIDDDSWLDVIVEEFKSARFIYKIMEALAATGWQRHAYLKYQIIQYASIYEAVVVYLLRNYFHDTPEYSRIARTSEFRNTYSLPVGVLITKDDEELFLCKRTSITIPMQNIRFRDKVARLIELGIISPDTGEDVCTIYDQRNRVHIERNVEAPPLTIEDAKQSYWRVQKFTEEVKTYFEARASQPISEGV